MKSRLSWHFVAAGLCLLLSSFAQAVPVLSFGAGSAVDAVFRQATFTNIPGYPASLLNYTEGGLIVSVNDQQCCFANVHYGDGGNNDYVTITTPEGLDFASLEFDLGSGFGGGTMHNVVWQTLRDGAVTGAGVITNVFASSGLSGGYTTLGWFDAALFDTLRVGASLSSRGYNAFGQFQAIALDNVKIGDHNAVPLPGTIGLLALGLVALLRNRRQAV